MKLNGSIFYQLGNLFGFRKWQFPPQYNFLYNYINVFNRSTIVQIDGGFEDLLNPVLQCPPLAIIINEKSKMFANMRLGVTTYDDVDLENVNWQHPVVRFMQKPNPLYNGLHKYARAYKIAESIYGNIFLHPLRGAATGTPMAIHIMPGFSAQVKYTGKIFEQVDINEIVQEYLFQINGQLLTYSPKEIIWNYDNFSYERGKGQSIIDSVRMPINNIVASLKSRNMLIVDKGIIGFISMVSKDGAGALPLHPDTKRKMEEDFNADEMNLYNNGNRKIKFASGTWNPMSFPVRDLILLEQEVHDAASLVDALGMNKTYFSWFGDTTFENQRQGIKSIYENTMQPEAEDFCRFHEQLFRGNLLKDNERLIADYSYLRVMKEDELNKQQADKVQTEKLSTLYKDNAITIDEYRKLARVEGELDLAYSQSNIRGLVGGVTGILLLNQNVAQGFIDSETAKNIIVSVYGYDEATAKAMVTTEKVDMTQTAPSVSIPKE